MANIYLTEQGSTLRKTGDRLIVQKDDEVLLEVQCSKIDAVLIFGNVQFTTQAVHELFEHGIEMALLTRSGKLIGQITSPFTKNIELRIAQFGRYHDGLFRLGLSKAIVKGKLNNCLAVIKSFSGNHPEKDLAGETAFIESSATSHVVKYFFKNINNIFIDLCKKRYFSVYTLPVSRRRNPIRSGSVLSNRNGSPVIFVFRSMHTFVPKLRDQ